MLPIAVAVAVFLSVAVSISIAISVGAVAVSICVRAVAVAISISSRRGGSCRGVAVAVAAVVGIALIGAVSGIRRRSFTGGPNRIRVGSPARGRIVSASRRAMRRNRSVG